MEKKTIEEYCRTIDKIGFGKEVRSIDISKNLKLSKNTVALTLAKLSNEGYINMKKYGKATLLPKGKKIAKKMNFKHRVLECFLLKIGLGKNEIHKEACKIEHVSSPKMIEKLYFFFGEAKS